MMHNRATTAVNEVRLVIMIAKINSTRTCKGVHMHASVHEYEAGKDNQESQLEHDAQ